MEVLSRNDGLLTNREVLDSLEERRARREVAAHNNIALQDREQVELNALRYLKASTAKDATSETVVAGLNAIKKLKLELTEGEMVQLANHVPVSEVEIYAIVEECAERLDASQVELLLQTIRETLMTPEARERMETDGGGAPAE